MICVELFILSHNSPIFCEISRQQKRSSILNDLLGPLLIALMRPVKMSKKTVFGAGGFSGILLTVPDLMVL